jgi:hypothetical protein
VADDFGAKTHQKTDQKLSDEYHGQKFLLPMQNFSRYITDNTLFFSTEKVQVHIDPEQKVQKLQLWEVATNKPAIIQFGPMISGSRSKFCRLLDNYIN